MADKKTYTALSKQEVTVPAYSVIGVDYIDTKPNYFRVQNQGQSNLYCSTSSIPTADRYDFTVSPSGMKMFAEPFERAKLYIFNPSGSDIRATVLSFKAEFDPLTLALSEISFDLSGASLNMSTEISSINAPLPAGTNTIGKVQVTSLPALPTGTNSIGRVEVSNLQNYTQQLANILTAIGNIQVSGGDGGGSSAANVVYAGSVEAISEGDNIDLTGKNVHRINFIANDSEEDSCRITITQQNGDPTFFELLPGEVVNDIDVPATAIGVKGGGQTVRYLVTGTAST